MKYEPHSKSPIDIEPGKTDQLLEVSPNNRAGCQVKACKDEGKKITKGEFRFAVQVTIHEHVSWQYRHW